ncbi:lectin [Chitinophaga polysaccharea]|uniref:lectin n=1 Tax=Chitinophaga polysaccharea TaxID=1293035 RepID=UPI00115A62B8|nr:lectin [Chitinophaga polysaccharea]
MKQMISLFNTLPGVMQKLGYHCLLLTSIACSNKDMLKQPDDPATPHIKSGIRTMAASPVGDVVGKLVVGYQGWFACKNDGSPSNNWIHWGSTPGGLPPSPGNQTFELWPDTREYTTTFQTGYANLGNGQPAKLFSSWTDQTVNTHFMWMQQYGIDCAAMQRFGKSTPQKDGIASKVMAAAQTYGRKFYVMYDISGWTNFQTEIKPDWTNVIVNTLHLTASPAYAKQNGKPVVCIWGVGVTNRPGNVTSWTDVINWFKDQGCYVIVGGPRDWRTQTANLPAYNASNMIMPWATGTFSNITGANNYVSTIAADFAYCNSNGIDYQAEAFPGFAWSNWKGGAPNQIPRLHGDFIWQQFANIRNQGIPSVYVGMFDEYDEATAIAKAAEDASMIPTNQYFLTLDADGVHVSSDFYLRLVGDAAKMIKGQTPLVWAHPTPHVVNAGGVTFYQNTSYGGTVSQVLPVGNYTMSQLAALGVPNDWASSVKIPAGRTLIMYGDDNFSGSSWTRTSDTPDFTALNPSANDKMSSCRVQ